MSRTDGPRMIEPLLEIRAKVWIERDGAVVISDFLAELLELISEHGSLSAAAEALHLPNRTAWKKLRQMEAAAGLTLVTSESGGTEGGGTRLTPAAESMLSAFHAVADEVLANVDERFASERENFPS